ncbi:21209_t:CDS:1, partial [Dentiscutata erythropus]
HLVHLIIRSQVIEPRDGNDMSKGYDTTSEFIRNYNDGGNPHSGQSDDRSGNDNYSDGRRGDGGSGNRDDNNDKDSSSNSSNKLISVSSVAAARAKDQDFLSTTCYHD